MSSFKIFDIAASGMMAQSTRLNTVASNLANAESVASSEEGAYKARRPVFQTILDENQNVKGVQVKAITEKNAPAQMLYEPGNPLADSKGYIYKSNVNPIEEMTDMISASRSYQNNIEVMNTVKQLMLNTLRLGQ